MLSIKLKEHDGVVDISVTRQVFYHNNFGGDGTCRFKASKGFVIDSICDDIQISPRLSKLHLPRTPDKEKTVSLSLSCGLHKTYIRDLKNAVNEYNQFIIDYLSDI